MACDTHDLKRNSWMLNGSFARRGYDWWWHSFTAINEKDGKAKPFFIEFFTCNPALGGKDPVFGQLPSNQKNHKKPSYLMVKVGTWGTDSHPEKCQLHRFFGWKEVSIHPTAPFSVTAGDCFVSDTETHGKVKVENSSQHPEWMSDDGEIAWNLTIDKDIPFNVGYGASAPFRFLKAFEMYWHAEGMKTNYRGSIICNGETYRVSPSSCYGYADKNWGRSFTSPWIWLSSCKLTSNLTGEVLHHSAFDIGGGRPKVFCFPLHKKLLGCFNYQGACYEFNFSKFWTGSKTRFDCKESFNAVSWHIELETKKAVLLCDVTCLKKDMLLVNYESPDGEKRHNRLWNGGNGVGRIRLFEKTPEGRRLIDDMNATSIGCEFGEYDR